MKAIVFADRLGKELLPLTDNTCVALLPMVGKLLLEHVLEDLAGAGVNKVTLIVSPYADQVKNAYGNGERWGMQLDYVLSRGEEAPEEFSQRLTELFDDELLVLRGDVLRSAVLKPFLALAGTVSQATVHGLINGQSAALCLCREGPRDLTALAWPPMAERLDGVTLANTRLSYLESLQAYHRANLDVAAGRFSGLLIPGREAALGLTIGRGSKVSPRSLKQGIAFVGAGSRVHPEAELLGEVVIADQVLVDRHASVRSSVILPNTYVGELVDLNQAIVHSNDLIRVDTGAVLRVTDAFLLADLKTDTLAHSLAVPLNRLLGLGLLLLSLPLWPLALVAAMLRRPGSPLNAVRLRGNRTALDELGMRGRCEFVAWEWATPVPILRYLPRVLSVISGDLRVVGTSPLTPEQADKRVQDWERLGDQAPAGLIGPTQLELPVDAPEEERLLSDAFYARQRTTSGDLRYLLRGLQALFSRRAWVS